MCKTIDRTRNFIELEVLGALAGLYGLPLRLYTLTHQRHLSKVTQKRTLAISSFALGYA